VCSHSGRLIDWEFGSRDREALIKLLKRLEPWNILYYCSDHYEAYKSLIPSQRLVQGKANTHGIERNNGQQRHWFLRFKRKSIAPSRSLEMINHTMALFAAYHVNKTLKLPCILN
jgi:insertion element IS1 protein InsB